MAPAGFLALLLLLTGGSTSNHTELQDDQLKSNQSSGPPAHIDGKYSEGNCSYQDIFRYLHLTKDNELFTMVRPVKDYRVTTWVNLKMVIYAILDVREIDQTLVLYVWIYMSWRNHHILWDPADFCGLNHVLFPIEVLWKPDLAIEEMVEKDKAPPSPYVSVNNHGIVELRNDQVLMCTCRMQVFKFPFDVQSCNISLRSAAHCDDEIKFEIIQNSSKITEWSREAMRSQYEWLFVNMTVINITINQFGYNQSMVVYTITMERRSILYIVNFLLPVLFFLFLDLASFLISDSGGEKLSFKVTVLLAVTVLQLILNEILPASSDRIPLIATYCIGVFGLMMLSLLETIVVMHLMAKDSKDNEVDGDQSLSEDCGDKVSFNSCFRDKTKWTHCFCVRDESADETPSETLSTTKQGSSGQLTEETHALEKVSHELSEVKKTLCQVLSCRKGDQKPPHYWTRVAKTINKVFFIFYITVSSVFLCVIFSVWSNAADD